MEYLIYLCMYSIPIYYEHYIWKVSVYQIVRIYCESSNFVNCAIWNTSAKSKLHTFLDYVFYSGCNIQKLIHTYYFFFHNKFPLVCVCLRSKIVLVTLSIIIHTLML